MLSDIEIAQSSKAENITEIAKKAGIDEKYIHLHGRTKAKVDLDFLKETDKPDGKLILVSAINPTPAGEGKTTVTIGLTDALNLIGKKTSAALREPSLGPVFGIKGGAAGGGYSQVLPMEDINLHFTGDFYAVAAANNLLAAMVDNHIYHGNALHIDPRQILWHRCVDMNDRQLRSLTDGLGGKVNGVPREDSFDITAASEIMAVLCLSDSISDLKRRLSKILVGYSYEGKEIFAGDIKAQGAMTALLKDAIRPNLVQTLEGNPVFVHGGPFANIAHGCNSVLATRMALKIGDYAVTEAGFGADLGAEKFLDIKCRQSGLRPSAVVIVATARALKMHGGLSKNEYTKEDLNALKAGIPNLIRHINNIKNVYSLPCVVAVNRFATDTQAELDLIRDECAKAGVKAVFADVWAKGGEGGKELAKEVVSLCDEKNDFKFSYPLDISVREKIEQVVKHIYGGSSVGYEVIAQKQLDMLEKSEFASLPICVAKTQYSFSDKPTLLGAPKGFEVTVKRLKPSSGAGFIVVYMGDIMTMPGLPKESSAENIDVDENGRISGLF